jgi:Methyltransferase domain
VANDQLSTALLPLDVIGIREATDKSSLIGDYLRHYEKLFANLRDEEFTFIEIGVFRGASARTWEQFFSRARIVGVDINPRCQSYASARITIEIGSQNDPAFLHRLVTTYPPRVIIDDGSHKSYDVIFTFERLFPALEPGGIYVIEDLHFHLIEHEAERLRGGSPILAHDYVVNLVRDRLGSSAHVARLEGIRRYLVGAIDRIEIVGQAAFIHKKADFDRLEALRGIRPHVEAAKDWNNWLSLSQKLLEAGGGDSAVVEALRRSIELNRHPIVTYHRLSEALERIKDFEGAIETLENAALVAQNDPDMLSDLRNRIGRLRNAHPPQEKKSQ